MKTLATGGGAIAGAAANKIGFINKFNTPIRGAIKIAVGAFLPAVLGKGKKSEVIENAGSGMIAVGALELYNGLVAKDDSTKALAISGIDVPTLPSLGEYPASRVYIDEAKDTLGELPTLGSTVDTY